MYEYEGKRYARVTEILGTLSDFSHIDEKVLANKARIGTEVHDGIADAIMGGFPVVGADGIGYFESFCKWRDCLKPEFVQSEKRYYDHERRITGQIDALVRLSGSDELPILIDFKTSVSESKVVWPMQAHLYAHLLAINGHKVQPRFLFIRLDKKGGLPNVHSYDWDANIHARCLKAIDEYWSTNPQDIAASE